MKLEDLCSDLVMLPKEHRSNGEALLAVLNPIEEAFIQKFGRPWKSTSGYRYWPEHVEIYRKMNEERKKEKLPPLVVPLKSNHLIFKAVDIYDPNQDVKFFVAEQLHLFEEGNIYFEAFKYTKDWVHMQNVAPRSRNRFFVPF